jgi:hypothetical protein
MLTASELKAIYRLLRPRNGIPSDGPICNVIWYCVRDCTTLEQIEAKLMQQRDEIDQAREKLKELNRNEKVQ